MFPLSTVLFPGAQMPIHIFEPRYRELTVDCLSGDGRFGIVLIARGSEVGGGDQRMSVGTQAVITKSAKMDDGRSLLLIRGESRIRVVEWLADDPYPLALVEDWEPAGDPVDQAALSSAISTVRRTRGMIAELGESSALSADVVFDDDPEVACWQLCHEAPLSIFDAQRLLAQEGTGDRLGLLRDLTEELEKDLHHMLSED
jgi:Lon protease-like protein